MAGLSGAARFARPARGRTLGPEEEASLMRKLGAAGLSGVAKVGHFLGTPLSITAALAAGEPETAIEGIFDPSKRIYGRELLEKWGVLGRNRPGLDWGDVAGFLAGLPLDPLFWVGAPLSATSRAGKLAEAAGLMKHLPLTVGPRVGRTLARMTRTPEHLIQAAEAAGKGAAARAAFREAATKAGYEAAEYLERPLGGLLNIGFWASRPSP